MTDESRPTPAEPPNPRTAPRTAPRSSRFFSSVDASMLGLGSQMFSEVAAGVLLGYGLDYMLGTKNRWIVVGSLAGVAVAMVSVIRVAMRPQTPRRRSPSGPTSQDAPSKPETGEAGASAPSRPNDDPKEAPRP